MECHKGFELHWCLWRQGQNDVAAQVQVSQGLSWANDVNWPNRRLQTYFKFVVNVRETNIQKWPKAFAQANDSANFENDEGFFFSLELLCWSDIFFVLLTDHHWSLKSCASKES